MAFKQQKKKTENASTDRTSYVCGNLVSFRKMYTLHFVI